MFVETQRLPYRDLAAGTRLRFVSHSGGIFVIEITDDELLMDLGGARHIQVEKSSAEFDIEPTQMFCVPLGTVTLGRPDGSTRDHAISTISPGDVVLLPDGKVDGQLPAIRVGTVAIDVPERKVSEAQA